jgi:serine/threonine protein kinase
MNGDVLAELRDAEQLQSWSIGRLLGRGGMGSVYEVTHVATGDIRAIKLMEPYANASEEAHQLVQREIDHCLALRHPRVVRSFEGGRVGDIFYLIMEYCSEGSADALVANLGPLPLSQALPLATDLLEGLDYAHHVEVGDPDTAATSTGLVHRDVKPANVLIVGAHRRAKVGDFGLAKAFVTAGMSGLTRTGSAAGTPAFMSREQVLDYKYAGPEVDVWAAAATLYFMLTALPPKDFSGGTDPWRVAWASDPVPLRDRRPDIPPGIAAVLDAALDDRAGIAFDSARGLADAVAQAGSAAGIEGL